MCGCVFVPGSDGEKQTAQALTGSSGTFFDLGSGVKQPPDVLVAEGLNTTLRCSQISTSYNSMLWYLQRHGQKHLTLIVHAYVNMVTVSEGLEVRYSATRHGTALDLTVTTANSSVTGVYFCVKQEAQW